LQAQDRSLQEMTRRRRKRPRPAPSPSKRFPPAIPIENWKTRAAVPSPAQQKDAEKTVREVFQGGSGKERRGGSSRAFFSKNYSVRRTRPPTIPPARLHIACDGGKPCGSGGEHRRDFCRQPASFAEYFEGDFKAAVTKSEFGSFDFNDARNPALSKLAVCV